MKYENIHEFLIMYIDFYKLYVLVIFILFRAFDVVFPPFPFVKFRSKTARGGLLSRSTSIRVVRVINRVDTKRLISFLSHSFQLFFPFYIYSRHYLLNSQRAGGGGGGVRWWHYL